MENQKENTNAKKSVEEPPKENENDMKPTVELKDIPKFESRMIIEAGENSCPAGFRRNSVGECVEEFD